MAYNLAFQISESLTPGVFTIQDSSSGSDPNLTGKLIYIYKIDGSLFTAAIPWSIADSSITLSILDKDYAFNIVVTAQSSSPLPSPSSYTASKIYAFTSYGMNFYGYLIQLLSSRPVIISDTDFYNNMNIFHVELVNAKFAIDYLEDQAAAQSAIERYQNLINNQNYFF